MTIFNPDSDFDFDFDFDLFFYPTSDFYFLFNQVETKRKGVLIHIATAGGYMPEYVYRNAFNHTTRNVLKNSREELEGQVRINPNLESILGPSLDRSLNTDTVSAMDAYTHDFSEYAKRNCFSFDRTEISNPLANKYHLVAAPPDENHDNKIPNHNHPYHFYFHQSDKMVFLILNHSKRNRPIQYDVIGYSPLDSDSGDNFN